jgi:hypothetical protein
MLNSTKDTKDSLEGINLSSTKEFWKIINNIVNKKTINEKNLKQNIKLIIELLNFSIEIFKSNPSQKLIKWIDKFLYYIQSIFDSIQSKNRTDTIFWKVKKEIAAILTAWTILMSWAGSKAIAQESKYKWLDIEQPRIELLAQKQQSWWTIISDNNWRQYMVYKNWVIKELKVTASLESDFKDKLNGYNIKIKERHMKKFANFSPNQQAMVLSHLTEAKSNSKLTDENVVKIIEKRLVFYYSINQKNLYKENIKNWIKMDKDFDTWLGLEGILMSIKEICPEMVKQQDMDFAIAFDADFKQFGKNAAEAFIEEWKKAKEEWKKAEEWIKKAKEEWKKAEEWIKKAKEEWKKAEEWIKKAEKLIEILNKFK